MPLLSKIGQLVTCVAAPAPRAIASGGASLDDDPDGLN